MFLYVVLAYVIIRFVILIVNNVKVPAFKLGLFKRRIRNVDVLIRNNFIDSQVLFITKFNALANVGAINALSPSTCGIRFTLGNVSKWYKYNAFVSIKRLSNTWFASIIFLLFKLSIIIFCTGWKIRTLIHGFGNRGVAITLNPHCGASRNRTLFSGFSVQRIHLFCQSTSKRLGCFSIPILFQFIACTFAKPITFVLVATLHIANSASRLFAQV